MATEPDSCRADAGDTNIPDPIITPRIILIAENNPSSRFSCMVEPFSLDTAMSGVSLLLAKINKDIHPENTTNLIQYM